MAVELETMEIKKQEQVTSENSKVIRDQPVADRAAKANKLWDFLADVKGELFKISWTTPDELRTYTKMVIATTFCFGMGVYFVDLTIQVALGTMESLIRLIGG